MIVLDIIDSVSQRFYQNDQLKLGANFCIDAINECLDMILSLCVAHHSDIGTEKNDFNITTDNNVITIDDLRAVYRAVDKNNNFSLDIVPISLGLLFKNKTGTPKCCYIMQNDIFIVPSADTTIEVTYWKDKKVLTVDDEIPFNGFFDYAVVNYVVMKAKAKDDEKVDFEKFLVDSFVANVEKILQVRKGSLKELPLPFKT